MNWKSHKLLALLLVAATLFAVSCFKDIETVPLDKDVITSAGVYDEPAAYTQGLSKVYAGLARTRRPRDDVDAAKAPAHRRRDHGRRHTSRTKSRPHHARSRRLVDRRRFPG